MFSGSDGRKSMSSIRELVMFAGTVTGMGRDESCMISAIKVSLPGTDEFMYTRFQIQNAPRDMPDGQYSVRYKGRTDALVKRDGIWLSAGL
jgi:hypothetical protein